MFSRLRLSITSVFGILLLCVPGATRAQTPPPADAARFATGAELVALDLVVRDKKGRLVTDLQASEIEVLENGVPQKIASFRALESGAPSAAGPAPAAASQPTTAGVAPDSAAQARRVVLAFGRLSSDGRRLAQSAGDEFAKKHVSPGTLVSVLKIDGTLVPVIEGAADPLAVKEAVRKATAAISGGPNRAMGPVGADNSYAGATSKRFEGGSGVLDMGQADNLAFLAALVTVVDGIATQAGRKTVVLFSEGFSIPPGYEHVFAELQSRANRSNVSFYALDVRGLQLSGDLGSSGAALSSAVAISAQQAHSSGGTPVTREEMTQDDVAQSSMRSDVVDALSNLATSTGGFLVTHTNDFGRPLARIAEDLRGYYEAGYAPSTPVGPGQYRRIEVRVARKDVRVQSRSGYYTTPPAPAASSPVVAFSAFTGPELPAQIDVRGRFYRFGRQKDGNGFDCLLKLDASLAAAEFEADAQGRLAGKLALAGRVLNASGDVVESFGQDIGIGGSEEQVKAARQQRLPLARRLRLAPGNYTLEFVVIDAVADKKTARRIPVTVPTPDGELTLSSLVIVAGVDPAGAKSDPTDPLLVGDQRIVPNLGVPVAPAPGAMLPIYYNVFVKPGSKDAVTASVEVTREGKTVARGTMPLAAPDAAGRITGLSPIPLQKLTAGDYVVKVSVTNGKTSTEETTTVTIGS